MMMQCLGSCGKNLTGYDFKWSRRGWCRYCYTLAIRTGTLTKLNIPCDIQDFSKEQEQILIGSLLGDGFLMTEKENKNFTARYSVGRAQIDSEYLIWNRDKFKDFCSPDNVKYRSQFDKRTNKKYHRVDFRTKIAPVFSREYKKWYPDGIKIIPKDIELSPIALAVWFCDDGSIKYNVSTFTIILCTNGFTFDDVGHISEKLSFILNEHVEIQNQKDKPVLALGDYASRNLINIMKNNFPPGMNRKMLWENKDFSLNTARRCKYCIDLNSNLSVLEVLQNNQFNSLEIKKLLPNNPNVPMNVEYRLHRLKCTQLIENVLGKYAVTHLGHKYIELNKESKWKT